MSEGVQDGFCSPSLCFCFMPSHGKCVEVHRACVWLPKYFTARRWISLYLLFGKGVRILLANNKSDRRVITRESNRLHLCDLKKKKKKQQAFTHSRAVTPHFWLIIGWSHPLCVISQRYKFRLSGGGWQVCSKWYQLPQISSFRTRFLISCEECHQQLQRAHRERFPFQCLTSLAVFSSVCGGLILQYRQKRHFVVYVMLPRGFGGDISTGGDQTIKAIMYFNYR